MRRHIISPGKLFLAVLILAVTLANFAEEHGGNNSRVANACSIRHTSVPSNTSQWPHAFQRSATQGTGNAGEA